MEGDASSDSIAAENPPIPRPITTSATAPNERNNTVWNAFTQAVPRMPPKNT